MPHPRHYDMQQAVTTVLSLNRPASTCGSAPHDSWKGVQAALDTSFQVARAGGEVQGGNAPVPRSDDHSGHDTLVAHSAVDEHNL